MKVNIFLKIKGIICFVFGLAMITFPGFFIRFYGSALDPAGIYMANLFGVSFLGLGLICWFTSQTGPSELKQNILLSLALIDTVGFGFTFFHQISGIVNILGWTTVALWLIFAAGCWVYRFMIKE